MNYIPDDKGNMVLAIGAPGSIERVRVQYPDLIERCRRQETSPAVALIRARGITSLLETANILTASGIRPVGDDNYPII